MRTCCKIQVSRCLASHHLGQTIDSMRSPTALEDNSEQSLALVTARSAMLCRNCLTQEPQTPQAKNTMNGPLSPHKHNTRQSTEEERNKQFLVFRGPCTQLGRPDPSSDRFEKKHPKLRHGAREACHLVHRPTQKISRRSWWHPRGVVLLLLLWWWLLLLQ